MPTHARALSPLALSILLLPAPGCVQQDIGSSAPGTAQQAQTGPAVAVGDPEVTVQSRPPEVVRLPDPAVVEPEVPGTRERFGGVGMVLSQRPTGLFVLEVVPGTAAEAAGIQPGDRIASVAGTPAADLSLADVVDRLRGEPGSTVDVDVLSPSGEQASHRLERGLITFEEDADPGRNYSGVGLVLGHSDDGYTVHAVLPGHGAERAGLRAGDRILTVDGQPVSALPMDAVVNRLRGDPGTSVEIQVQGVEDASARTLEVTREAIQLEQN